MKKKNKIIAIIVALVLIISIFVVGTVANTKNTSIAISIDKTELTAGQSATVTVTASADYPVATASIPVFYDKTMVTVSNATATLTGYAVAEVTTDLTAVDSAKIYANTNMNSEKFGFVLVTYIGGANDTVSTIDNKTILTFTITAKSDVSGDALVKCVTESAKTDDNVEGMLYFGATTSGTTITSIPENVENIDVKNASKSATITTGGADLVAIENTTAVVDTEKGYVYGVTAGADDLTLFFKVENGTFEMVANEGGYTNGTGATLVVKDTKGETAAEYTLVVFGDVDGDATLTAADANLVKNASLGGAIEGEANNMAADVDGDKALAAADANVVKNASLGGEITVNPYVA